MENLENKEQTKNQENKTKETQNFKKKNWAKNKVDEATKKINREVYKRNRQASIQIQLDDLAIFINDKITRRGIAKGLVKIQEDLNKNILECQKLTVATLLTEIPKEQFNYLKKFEQIIKIHIWTDIRFLMINKAITPGEITELIRRQNFIDKDFEKWLSSVQKAIFAQND